MKRYNVTVTYKSKNQAVFPGVRANSAEQAIVKVRDELEARKNGKKFPIKKIAATHVKQW